MMMVVEIENIIEEIKVLEKEYDAHMKDASLYPTTKQIYLDQANVAKKKIERRMRILEILKD